MEYLEIYIAIGLIAVILDNKKEDELTFKYALKVVGFWPIMMFTIIKR